MSERIKSRLLLAVVIGLVALLPVLAMMQYHWVGQISENEGARMRTNLDASVQRFSEELNRIFDDAERTFRIASVYSPEVLAAELRASYQAWKATSDYPELIEHVYWVRYDAAYRPVLYRMLANDGTFRAESWPSHMEPWYAYYTQYGERQRSRSSRATTFASRPRPTPPRIPLGLSILVLEENTLDMLWQRFGTARRPPPMSFVLLDLNEIYLSEWVFPNLTRNFFSDGSSLDYDLMIVEHDAPDEVVYQSAFSLTPTDFETADARTSISIGQRSTFAFLNAFPSVSSAFHVFRADSASGNYSISVQQPNTKPSSLDGLIDFSLSDTSGIFVSRRRAENVVAVADSSFSVIMTEGSNILVSDSLRITVNALMRSPLRTTSIRANFADDTHARWHLWVKHKAGSLQAAVTQSRIRNLGISFGILLLLGGATVLIYVSSQRSTRLAAQQMEFVAGVSHELRTPLAVIRSAAENLSDGVVKSPAQAQKYGTLIHKEGRRLSEMVEQVLELAGAQSGRQTFVMQPVSPTLVIEEALAQCRHDLDEANFTVDVHIAHNLPSVQADQRALESALRNLIMNAVKYSPDRRWLRIEAKAVTTRAGETVAIRVQDRGRGIPAHEIPHLFDPFFRGEAVRADQIHGNGLGLSLVHRTIKAHGGRITVQSTEDEGSTFTLHLPISPTEHTHA